jgi:UDPglucose 6-dehydrogenase
VINKLLAAGATITAYDPEAMENVKELLGDQISYADDQYKALAGADALIIATEWSVFRSPEFDKLKSGLKEKVILTGVIFMTLIK